ncbi:MAG: beta-N-acetylhexosaminidase [Chitinophagaceae bacterium]
MKKSIILITFLLCIHLAKADSLDIKIGQMIMIGMNGKAVTSESPILKDIQKGLVGGILLYEYNLQTTNTKAALQNMTSALQDASKIPLLISIDQEGGQVNRLKEKYGFPYMPSAKYVGNKNQDDYTEQVGKTIAQSLISVGINLNYAPVLDVNNPNCPVLGKRSRCFSSNTNVITHIASILINAHREQGVRTVVKHFPGHGNSQTDSHLGMADVSKYWQEKELIPYQKLIEAHEVDAIMTAHIINRKLDSSGLPATLSKVIIQDLLRKKMNYNGVVITDDMQMHAISKFYGFEESIKKAILAGVDILMFSNNIKGASNYSVKNIHSTIKKLVRSHVISEERINESYKRIMQLKNNIQGVR